MNFIQKLEQRARETFDSSAKTPLPEDLQELGKKAEGERKKYDKEISALQEFIQPDPTKRALSSIGASKDSSTVKVFETLGKDLVAQDDEAGDPEHFFRETGEALKKIGEEYTFFLDYVKTYYLEPKVRFFKGDLKIALEDYERAKSRRLDYDTKKHQLQVCKPEKRAKCEAEVQNAQKLLDDACESAKQRLHFVVENRERILSEKAQTAQFVKEMRKFFVHSVQCLDEIQKQFDLDKIAASEPPLRVAGTPTVAPTSPAQRDPTQSPQRPPQPNPTQPALPSRPGAIPAVPRGRALYDFLPQQESDLPLRAGDIVMVTDQSHSDWWKGTLNGRTGMFPSNFVQLI